MSNLVPVHKTDDILPDYRSTPIGDMLGYHNLRYPHRTYDRAQLVIGMCMDNRHVLRFPDNFAFILRTGGARLQRIEFKVSFAIAIGGVRSLALIGHDQCGMVGLRTKREEFVTGLMANAGWARQAAEEHFDRNAAEFEVADTAQFILDESRRLKQRYPLVQVAPLFYKIQDGLLYQLTD